ncbi:rod shape-determining protein MreC [Schnuerera sp. xch1]|uniref:rod shape-determining protein MreC n=1 Tax=Schnuerera sp. xch1 TaxID=2874283 RepID=UPI001CBA707B|nr:rod shape-determining protein MreC [Schnuerera sp. xch1]MBZ2175341.1 rod shape-determining protein MreC [Schnuerera sp. xch1]
MFFIKKYKNRMIVVSIAIILIIIIGNTSSERVSLTSIEKIIGNIFSPTQKFFFNVSNGISNFFTSIKDIGNLREENKELKSKVLKLEEENRNYEDLIGKSEYLINEKKLIENTTYNLISAEITGKEPGNWFDRFTIDKGSKDGIAKGDTVIQAIEIEEDVVQEGIIGRVIDVGNNWAKVNSIIDENNNISFRVIRTQDGGILSGSINGEVSGYLFDSKADVMKGDKLISSGLGGIYTKDMYIGEITDVIKEEEDLMKKIKVEPAVDFKKIFKVFVITD